MNVGVARMVRKPQITQTTSMSLLALLLMVLLSQINPIQNAYGSLRDISDGWLCSGLSLVVITAI